MKSTKHKRVDTLIKSRQILVSITMNARNQRVKPWQCSPLGQHGFDPIGMATCLVLKQLSYDELVGYLQESPKLLATLYLKKVPSRSALQAAFCRIREEFLTWAINSIGRPGMKGTLYGDATAIAVNEHRTWMDAKKRIVFKKRLP